MQLKLEDIDERAPEWNALATLFGAYLYPDYDLDFKDWRHAVRDYRHGVAPTVVKQAINGIDVLLDNFSGDGDLERAVDRLGLEYGYHPADRRYRIWLGEVADILRGKDFT
jgi:hypothetical protein